MKQFLTLGLLVVGLISFAGCESVDSKLDVPDGRNSDNDRYQDDDVIGPVLKFKLKDTPKKQEDDQLQAQQDLADDEDY